MNNTKLINILRTFSKSEMKEFEKVVLSPFFNRGRNHMPLLKQLKKFHPKFDDEKMTPEYIYSKMHPGKKFNKQIIWNATSSLLKMAEEFLAQVYLKKNGFVRNSHINDELYDRKLTKILNKNLDDLVKELDKIGITSNYFEYKTHLEAGKIGYRFLEDEQHLVHFHIAKKGEYAVLDFLRTIAGVVSDMRSNTRMFNAKFDINIPYEFINNLHLDKIIAYSKNKKFIYSDIMEMYYCTIMMAINQGNSFFFRFKELFEKNSEKFESEERATWLTLLANYCSDKVNDGEYSYKKTLFEVNKIQLREVEKSPKVNFGKILYLQTLRNAISINEIKWSKSYIEKYTPYLKTSYQKSMRAMANSFLFFKLKDYNKVIENLGKVKFIDVRDKFLAKSLYIRAYYELGEIQGMHYQIDSAKQFINKNSALAKHTRENFNIFLNYMTRLLHYQENNNIDEIELLKNKIEKQPAMINGEWLLQKIKELNKHPVSR